MGPYKNHWCKLWDRQQIDSHRTETASYQKWSTKVIAGQLLRYLKASDLMPQGLQKGHSTEKVLSNDSVLGDPVSIDNDVQPYSGCRPSVVLSWFTCQNAESILNCAACQFTQILSYFGQISCTGQCGHLLRKASNSRSWSWVGSCGSALPRHT